MTATAVAVILALYWIAPWQKPMPFRLPLVSPDKPREAQPVPPPVPAAVPPVSPPATQAPQGPAPTTAPQESAKAAPVPPAPTAALSTPNAPTAALPPAPVPSPVPPSASPVAPSFDVVRVETHGETVIAGRAEPGSTVALVDGDKVVARVTADPSGQFALLPDALTEGSHFLTLQVQKPGQDPVRSVQGVAVSVAKGGSAKPLVALLAPDKAAKVLSGGLETPGSAAAGNGPLAAATPVAIQSVEAGQGGKFTAAGVAHPGSQCRVYLNGSYLADVTAGKDGHWSIEVQKGMKAGRYTVRADEIEAGSGKVTHRAEVPFDYPVAMAGNEAGTARQTLTPQKPDVTAPTIGPVTAPPVVPMPPPRPASPQVASAAPDMAQTAVPAASPATPSPASTETTGEAPAPSQAAVTTSPAAASPAVAPSPSASAAVIADLQTTTVIRGDSLWRISRRMLGHGIQYTEIYASNTDQIRDPDLIYPGQIFVVPSKKPN